MKTAFNSIKCVSSDILLPRKTQITVYRYSDAPKELIELSPSGNQGDEDWMILARDCTDTYYLTWLVEKLTSFTKYHTYININGDIYSLWVTLH